MLFLKKGHNSSVESHAILIESSRKEILGLHSKFTYAIGKFLFWFAIYLQIFKHTQQMKRQTPRFQKKPEKLPQIITQTRERLKIKLNHSYLLKLHRQFTENERGKPTSFPVISTIPPLFHPNLFYALTRAMSTKKSSNRVQMWLLVYISFISTSVST